jgi:hypothetical protein
MDRGEMEVSETMNVLPLASPLFASLCPMGGIMAVVTPLAKGGEVAEVASLGAVIVDMGAGEDNL